MKKLFGAAIVLACLAALGATAMAAEEKVYNLNFTSVYMERHPTVQNSWLPWAETIKKRTNGRVTITFFNPNTLCPEPEIFDAVRKGQVDIGHNTVSRNQGKLTVPCVFDIPTVITYPPVAAEVFWRMVTEIPEIQAEFKGIKLLAVGVSAPTQLDLAKGNVLKLEDIKGKKILAGTGDQARLVRALGGNPVVMPVPDFYLSLSRNMADGCWLPRAPLRSYKISETLQSITVGNFAISGFWMGINQQTWDSLPADLQKIIEEESGLKLSIMNGQTIHDGDMADTKIMEKDGVKMNSLSPEERSRWLAITQPTMRDLWFGQMQNRKEVNAQKVYDHAQKIVQEVADKHGIK